jgi:hypothetical protein
MHQRSRVESAVNCLCTVEPLADQVPWLRPTGQMAQPKAMRKVRAKRSDDGHYRTAGLEPDCLAYHK